MRVVVMLYEASMPGGGGANAVDDLYPARSGVQEPESYGA